MVRLSISYRPFGEILRHVSIHIFNNFYKIVIITLYFKRIWGGLMRYYFLVVCNKHFLYPSNVVSVMGKYDGTHLCKVLLKWLNRLNAGPF